MYSFLTGALKRRIIRDLRDMVNLHPNFRDKLLVVPRFPQEQRPNQFIRVYGGNAKLKRLDASNHLGEVLSFVQLLKVESKPGTSIEWVREDSEHIESLSPPGVYFVEITGPSEFHVGSFKQASELVYHAYVTGKSPAVFQLDHFPVYGRVEFTMGKEQGEVIYMVEGEHFTLDHTTGQGEMLEEVGSPGWSVTAKYLWDGSTSGPFKCAELTSNNIAIPGVVLAFGRRVEVGDKQAVMVSEDREPQADAIGGKWELALTLESWALDPDYATEVMDYLATTFWGTLFQRYASDGIALIDFEISGEAEEVYDETTDQTWFQVNGSMSCLCDWEIHIPRPYRLYGLRGVTIPDPNFPDGRSIVPYLGPVMVSHTFDYERVR